MGWTSKRLFLCPPPRYLSLLAVLLMSFSPAFAVTIGGTSPVQEIGISPDSLNVHQVLKQRSTCEFRVPDTEASILIEEGREVLVYDDLGARIFAGTIDEVGLQVQPGAGRIERFFEVRCIDFNQLADKRSVGEYTWTDTAIGQIVRDIVSQSMDGDGVNIDGVQDGPIIPLFQTLYGTCAEAFTELCKVAAALISSPASGLDGLEWQWFIDYDRKLHFFAPGSVTPIVEMVGDDPDDLFTAEPTLATIDLTADDFKAGTLRVRVTRERYANKVVALFNGEVAVAFDEVEIAARTVIEGTSGIYEKVFKLDDRTVITTLQEYADAQLANLKEMSRVLNGSTQRKDLRVGQTVYIGAAGYGEAPSPDVSFPYLIRSITIRDERATVLWRDIEAIAGPLTLDYVEWIRELRGSSSSVAVDDLGVIAYA